MYYRVLLLGVIAFVWTTSTLAGEKGVIAQCLSIKSTSERIQCYGGVMAKELEKNGEDALLFTREEFSRLIVDTADASSGDDAEEKKADLCSRLVIVDRVFKTTSLINYSTIKIRIKEERDRINAFSNENDIHAVLEKNKLSFELIECIGKGIHDVPSTKKERIRRSKEVRLMDIDDLRLDMASLNGTTLKVKGVGFYMAGVFMIKRNALDLNPIIVDITRLTRDERRHILGHCVDIMNGCHLTVRGKVRGDSIISDRIDW